MLKVLQIIILLFFTLLTSVVVHASTLEEHVIEVRGQAAISVSPDNFSLTLAIVKIGRNTSKLRALVDHKSNQVIKITDSLGIASKNINSARVNLRVINKDPRVHYQGVEVKQSPPQSNSLKNKVYLDVEPADKDQDKSQNFELSRTITVRFSSIEAYDKFLTKVMKLGIERISPLSMSVANSDEYYQQALVKAIDNAKEKAQRLAKQANISIGKLVYLKELSSNHYQPRLSAASMYSGSAVEHHSQVAETIISASVLIKFVIKE